MPRQDVAHHTQMYIWDFTFFGLKIDEETRLLPGYQEFIISIQPYFKKWVFQLEACPKNGTLHFQGRGSLFKKKRHDELCKIFNECELRGMDISESSSNSNQFEIFYALKQDSRTDGPWDNRSYRPPPYIPRQHRGIVEQLYPWQQTILDSKDVFDDRGVDVIVNPRGMAGKSAIGHVCRLIHGCLRLPPISDSEKLLQAVCNRLSGTNNRAPGIIFIDMPRAVDQRKMGAYFIAIEEIKGGYVCDLRYKFQEWDFDSPRVWVFMNREPDTRQLSKDRWRFWKISGLQTLVRYEPVEPES